jgi:hypothetical protein
MSQTRPLQAARSSQMRNVVRCLTGAGLGLALCSRLALAAPPIPAQPTPAATAGDRAQTAEEVVDLEGVLQGSTVAPPPAPPAVRLRGLLTLHTADGVGAGGQLRLENFGLRASVAYQPQHFLVDDDPVDDKFARFELAHTAQLNLDALYLFGESEKGVSLSYRYSTLLGHGLGVAYQSYIELAGARFELSTPVVYYPAAARRVPKELGLQGDEQVNFPFGPGLEYGIGFAWLF